MRFLWEIIHTSFSIVGTISVIIHSVCLNRMRNRWETRVICDNTSGNQSGIIKITNNSPKKLNIFNSHSLLKISSETVPICHSSSKSHCFLLIFFNVNDSLHKFIFNEYILMYIQKRELFYSNSQQFVHSL